MSSRHTQKTLEGFGAVDIEADLDGWSATVPGGYAPLTAAWVVPLMLVTALMFAVGLLLAGGWVIAATFWVPLLVFYGAVKHALRARRSTRLEVSHGDLRIQARHLGRDVGDPLRLALSKAPNVHIEGAIGIQEMTIGPHTFPVHAAPADLDAVVEMLRESTALAQEAGERAPVPAALRALLGQQQPQ